MNKDEAQALFDAIAPEFITRPDVALGRMFGTTGLGVRGKIFAFVGTDGDLIAKLGEQRTGELVADGVAVRKVMRGRDMREWISVTDPAPGLWRELMEEGYAYLDEITPR